MDARQLRYFLRIVESRSISRAAADLRIAQSALSLHVANLEAELGVPLLVRSRRGIMPTECGELLVAKARLILGQLDNAVQEIRSYAADPAGNVTLGLPASIAAFFSAPLLMQIKYRYPNISLRVVDGVSADLLALTQESRIDLALVVEVGEVSATGVERLVTERLYLVGAGPRRFDRAASVRSTKLAGLPLILPGRNHGIRVVMEDFAERIGIELPIKFEVDALPAIKELVRSEFGYTILPTSAIRDEVKRGDMWTVELTSPAPQRTIILVRPPKQVPSRASDAVRRTIRDLVVKLVSDGDWPATLLIKPSSEQQMMLDNVDWV
jgi:LysR family transcriptional regulator, nitrogen assimilation regulatory protein